MKRERVSYPIDYQILLLFSCVLFVVHLSNVSVFQMCLMDLSCTHSLALNHILSIRAPQIRYPLYWQTTSVRYFTCAHSPSRKTMLNDLMNRLRCLEKRRKITHQQITNSTNANAIEFGMVHNFFAFVIEMRGD